MDMNRIVNRSRVRGIALENYLKKSEGINGGSIIVEQFDLMVECVLVAIKILEKNQNKKVNSFKVGDYYCTNENV
ncbi:hypothetical protein [Wukongibacter sp. M2B1]|uniref:hypothetical protein n=1 Tax=Wukongibacter sp. M2B1 TaxID=3088895 RepID=UPI003D7B987F